jgi:hypothetical protein
MGVAKATTAGDHIERYERVRWGDYFADIRRDKRLKPEVYHCVVQREGSTEILAWSQFRSLNDAQRFADKYIRDLSGPSGNQRLCL